MNGVIVRLFFSAGSTEVPRVVLIRLLLAGWLLLVLLPRCSVPAPWVRRGVVLCAGGPDVFVVVERLRFLAPDRVLASVSFLFWSWGLPPSRAG